MCFTPNPAPRILAYINFHQIGLFVSLDVVHFKHRIQIDLGQCFLFGDNYYQETFGNI